MSLEIFGVTDVGLKRETNEDDFLCVDLSQEVPSLGRSLYLLLVADGVGGHQAGGQASSLASESVRGFIRTQLRALPAPADLPGLLEQACLEANVRIHQRASQDSDLTGMGSTLVAALVNGGTAHLANIGDSRAYRIHRTAIVQVSRDHSWAEEQRRHNALSEEEINHSPFKHMITRSLGYEPLVQVDTFQVGLEDGDYLLLCSDGLYGILSDRAILKVVRKSKEPEKICRKLVEEANRAGSRDNITVVVALYHPRGEERRVFPSQTVSLDPSRGKDWDFQGSDGRREHIDFPGEKMSNEMKTTEARRP